jgi:hypothetical protein
MSVVENLRTRKCNNNNNNNNNNNYNNNNNNNHHHHYHRRHHQQQQQRYGTWKYRNSTLCNNVFWVWTP